MNKLPGTTTAARMHAPEPVPPIAPEPPPPPEPGPEPTAPPVQEPGAPIPVRAATAPSR